MAQNDHIPVDIAQITSYMYYFNNCDYCPNCGAKMDGGAEGEN